MDHTAKVKEGKYPVAEDVRAAVHPPAPKVDMGSPKGAVTTEQEIVQGVL